MIFIFDNVVHKKKLMKFIKPAPSAIIVTSQLAEWSDLFEKIELKVLEFEEARQFVNAFLNQKRKLTDHDIAQLCKKVSYLPLALQQAVSYMNSCSISLEVYLKEYDANEKLLLSKPHLDENCNKTVAITWKMAFHRLKRRWVQVILMGKISQKKSLMTGMVSVSDAFLVLQRYSLVNKHEGKNDDGDHVIFNMHILVQKFIQWSQNDGCHFEKCVEILLNNSDVISPHTDAGKYQCLHLLYLLR